MNKLTSFKLFMLSVIVSGIVFISCDKNDGTPELTDPNENTETEEIQKAAKLEVSGSVCNGIYVFDDTYKNGIKYIHEDNETLCLKTFSYNDSEYWGLFKKSSMYYVIESSDEIPPECGWSCGGGLDKPHFKVTPIYE